MKTFAIISLLLIGAFGSRVTPMEKTLQLLTDLSAKVTKDGEASAKVYSEFYENCEDTAKDLEYEIKTAVASESSLSATVEKATSDISIAETKISDLASSLASDNKDLEEATALRAKQNKDFVAADKEMAETVDTLKRAIAILEEVVKGKSFVQSSSTQAITNALMVLVNAEFVQSADKAKVQALLQQQEDDEQPAGAPAAAVYETHSTSILEVLEDMLEKAEDAKESAMKDEMVARHNFEMTEQKLKDSIAVEEAELGETKKAKANAEETKAGAEGDLVVTSKDRSTDEEKLHKIQADCMTGASDYEQEQKERQEELNALAEATKILKEMTGGAADRAYSFVQVRSFLRLSRSRMASVFKRPVSSKVFQRLQKLADETHETVLLTLASRVKSAVALSDDPFAKVKGLISDMIAKLLADQAAEDSHKAWCDEETAETTAKKEDKEDIVADLSSKIDKATARVAKLTDDVAVLQAELGTIAANQKKMDKIRADAKAAFAAAKTDYENGVEGVTLALKVLREYYAEPKGEELVQTNDVNSTMSMAQEKKETDSATGILGMLEVILSDFSKLLAEGQASEDLQIREYEELTQENKVATLTKSKDVEYKTKETKQLNKFLEESKVDLASTQTELDSINEYMATIEASCVAKPETYEERKSRRDAELAGLKEALTILEGESLIQTKSFLRRA